MFGVNKEQLVKGLCRVSTRLCGYIGSRCDCKYIQNTDDDTMDFGSEATGCPETAMAAALINSMTTQEFYAIARRASIQVSLPEESEIKIDDLMQKLKKQRVTNLQQDAHRFTIAANARKTARLAKKAAKK